MPHKHIDIAVAAFNRIGRPLVVAGDGPDSRRLRSLAGPNVSFTGRVSDAEVANLLSGARGLVVTAAEEFGMAAVEAQAAGRPVISVKSGGALETVRDGVTGCFWAGGPEELAATVLAFDADAVDPAACVRNALRFDRQVFRRTLLEEVDRTVASHRSDRPLRQHQRPGAAPSRSALRFSRRGRARPFV
jgi:glycosyltransferase involved in cell wall biosynthesis